MRSVPLDALYFLIAAIIVHYIQDNARFIRLKYDKFICFTKTIQKLIDNEKFFSVLWFCPLSSLSFSFSFNNGLKIENLLMYLIH